MIKQELSAAKESQAYTNTKTQNDLERYVTLQAAHNVAQCVVLA
jgi:hypothetical protein